MRSFYGLWECYKKWNQRMEEWWSCFRSTEIFSFKLQQTVRHGRAILVIIVLSDLLERIVIFYFFNLWFSYWFPCPVSWMQSSVLWMLYSVLCMSFSAPWMSSFILQILSSMLWELSSLTNYSMQNLGGNPSLFYIQCRTVLKYLNVLLYCMQNHGINSKNLHCMQNSDIQLSWFCLRCRIIFRFSSSVVHCM